MKQRAAVFLFGVLVLGGLPGPATAGFPEDLEGELRQFSAAPLPPLAGSGLLGQGTFRLEAGAGGDLRTSPGTAQLVVPGGFLRGEPASVFGVSPFDVPLEPLLGGIDWYALGFATTPGLGGYGLPLVRYNADAALGFSVIELISWNFLWVLLVQSGGALPYALLDLEAPTVFASLGLPHDSEEPPAANAFLSMLLSLLGLDASASCPDTGAPICEIRELLASLASRPLADDPGEAVDLRWIWQAGGAYDVVHASGSLAAYDGWRLLALGPEVFGSDDRGVAFLLVPPPGVAAPPSGTALVQASASGLLAGGYGVEQDASLCSGADLDGDGMPDSCDNCTGMANGPAAPAPGEQDDADGDGFGDACDCDFGQDGSCNVGDFIRFLPDFFAGHDSGIGTDMDGDGAVTIGDFRLFLPGFVAGEPGPSALAP